MKLASELINLEVFSLDDNTVVGTIRKIIIDPKDGRLVAFQILGKDIRKKKNIVSFRDVLHLDHQALVIQSLDSLETKEDLPKAYDLLRNTGGIFRKKVFRDDGRYLGRVANFALDFDKNQLARIYVTKIGLSSFLKPQSIFSLKNIEEIGKKKIVISA